MQKNKAMTKDEMIKKLQENPAICWILWEANNLEATFNVLEDDGPAIETRDVMRQGQHHMVDTLENLRGSCMILLGLDPNDNALWDMMEERDLVLKPRHEREDGIFKIN